MRQRVEEAGRGGGRSGQRKGLHDDRPRGRDVAATVLVILRQLFPGLQIEAAGAGGFDLQPWEELAKYHEHRRRDVAAARAVVVEALALARAAAASPRFFNALTHRLARLERRLGLAGRVGG